MTGRKRNPRPDPEFADTAFVSAQDIAKIYGIPAAYIVKSAGDGKFPTPLQMGGEREVVSIGSIRTLLISSTTGTEARTIANALVRAIYQH